MPFLREGAACAFQSHSLHSAAETYAAILTQHVLQNHTFLVCGYDCKDLHQKFQPDYWHVLMCWTRSDVQQEKSETLNVQGRFS